MEVFYLYKNMEVNVDPQRIIALGEKGDWTRLQEGFGITQDEFRRFAEIPPEVEARAKRIDALLYQAAWSNPVESALAQAVLIQYYCFTEGDLHSLYI